jgi:hypothetical protein
MPQRRDEVLIGRAEVLRQLGDISARKLRELIAERRFPAGRTFGRGERRWMQRDVDSYLWLTMRCREDEAVAKPKKPPAAQNS